MCSGKPMARSHPLFIRIFIRVDREILIHSLGIRVWPNKHL